MGGADCFTGKHILRVLAQYAVRVTAYLKYQDKALTSFLERPCFPRTPDLSGAALLTPEESFDLKAYLRQVSLSQTQLPMHARTLHPGQTATLVGSRGPHSNTKGETP